MQTKNAPWGILWDPSNIKSIDIINPVIYFETTTIISKLPINITAAVTYAGTLDQSGEEKKYNAGKLVGYGSKADKRDLSLINENFQDPAGYSDK